MPWFVLRNLGQNSLIGISKKCKPQEHIGNRVGIVLIHRTTKWIAHKMFGSKNILKIVLLSGLLNAVYTQNKWYFEDDNIRFPGPTNALQASLKLNRLPGAGAQSNRVDNEEKRQPTRKRTSPQTSPSSSSMRLCEISMYTIHYVVSGKCKRLLFFMHILRIFIPYTTLSTVYNGFVHLFVTRFLCWSWWKFTFGLCLI